MNNKPKVGYDYEQITVNGATLLTTAKYKPSTSEAQADSAFITASGGEMRYRYDGTAPTASLGHILADGNFLILEGQNQMEKFQAIKTGDRNGTLDVTYERI